MPCRGIARQSEDWPFCGLSCCFGAPRCRFAARVVTLEPKRACPPTGRGVALQGEDGSFGDDGSFFVLICAPRNMNGLFASWSILLARPPFKRREAFSAALIMTGLYLCQKTTEIYRFPSGLRWRSRNALINNMCSKIHKNM